MNKKIQHLFILLFLMMTLVATPVYSSDNSNITTEISENGIETTVITDENGNQLTIEDMPSNQEHEDGELDLEEEVESEQNKVDSSVEYDKFYFIAGLVVAAFIAVSILTIKMRKRKKAEEKRNR